jgi:predicted transcriptional regulator
MAKYRSRADIIAAILDVARDGSLKTRMMYRAFLSWPQLNEYLLTMKERDLLKQSDDDGLYYTTEKGKRFVTVYNECASVLFPHAGKIKAIATKEYAVIA